MRSAGESVEPVQRPQRAGVLVNIHKRVKRSDYHYDGGTVRMSDLEIRTAMMLVEGKPRKDIAASAGKTLHALDMMITRMCSRIKDITEWGGGDSTAVLARFVYSSGLHRLAAADHYDVSKEIGG